MRRNLKFLTIILLIIVIFIGGYFIKLLRWPIEIPPKAPLSLSVYGRLIDYSQNELTTFKIQSEIVNWELNNTYLEIETKPILSYDITVEYLDCIKQKTEEECKAYIYHKYRLSEENCRDIKVLSKKDRYIVECDIKFYFPWEKPLWRDSLIKGNNYVFYFYKSEWEGPWDSVRISENFTKYKEIGASFHKTDLLMSFIHKEESFGEGIVRIIPLVITEGETGNIQIKLTNKQDINLDYEINSTLLKRGDIRADRCVANGLNQKGTVKIGETKIINITVKCNDVVKDLIEDNETFADYFVTSTFKFTDELENEHQKIDTFSFAIRPTSRCSPPDEKNYILFENLPIGKERWREEVYYYYVEGFTMDPKEVKFTEVGENQVILWLDNPAATFRTPKITFLEEKPEIKKRVQIYGTLDHGEFIAYKWCYLI